MHTFSAAVALWLLALSLTAANAGERTYRWTDEKGRVHYSDVPSQKSQRVQIRPGSRQPAKPKESPDALVALQLDCQSKKDQLTAYSNGGQVKETDALGRARIYTDDEKRTLLDRIRAQMTEVCAKAGVATQPVGGAAPDA